MCLKDPLGVCFLPRSGEWDSADKMGSQASTEAAWVRGKMVCLGDGGVQEANREKMESNGSIFIPPLLHTL